MLEEPILKKKKKRSKSYLYFGILGLFLLVGVAFAIPFVIELFSVRQVAVTTDELEIAFADTDGILLNNAEPLRDEEGINLTGYTFTITNYSTSDAYLKLEIVSDNTSTLDTNYLRYAISYNDRIDNVSNLGNDNNIILKDFFLEKDAIVEFNLKIWLDYYYDGGLNKLFSSKVKATIGQKEGILLTEKMMDDFNNLKINAVWDTNTHNGTVGTPFTKDLFISPSEIREFRYNLNNMDNSNYVYYNCHGNDNSGESCELWRIIGYFKYKDSQNNILFAPKIVRNEPLIDKNFDSLIVNKVYDSTQFTLRDRINYPNSEKTFPYTPYIMNKTLDGGNLNDFSKSGLYKYLNNDYLNTLSPKALAMINNVQLFNTSQASDALMNGQDTENYFYNLGESVTGSLASFSGISLLSLSDYAYSYTTTHVPSLLYNANPTVVSDDIVNSYWLYDNSIAPENHYNLWLMDFSATSQGAAFYIDGGTGHIARANYSNNAFAVKPVVYLKPNVVYLSGDGTINSPYVLK